MLRLATALLCALMLAPPARAAGEYDQAFERDLYKRRFAQEVQFRAAAIHVAWGAEALCDATTQIEPFVLLSVHSMRQRMSENDLKVFRAITGMDEKWRVVWADEGAPDELKVGDVVVAINDRKLPGGGTRLELSALFRGGAMVSNDDQGFWDVMLEARKEAAAGKPMRLTLEGGRKLEVDTQRGCAGSVTASSFDSDPDVFWRLGNKRAKIPANAMLEAQSADEFRWLAAFGTYFQASQSAINATQKSEGVSNGFLVGKILAIAVPGAGMLLSAAEAQAEKAIAVDSIVGNADLFANEVVASLGGDPAAGLHLTERMAGQNMKVDAVLMDSFRRSNAAEHARRIKALQAAQAERERQEARAVEEAQRGAGARARP
ncbi:conserved exported hypothetical protein [Rubrivivax sp. A210]|uniref:hypothetical protein n=1 Tax=Rubrivivax sp. A210 TaxID=2772301 RepID=UPI001917FEF5|nr:hypothetical protein [Rubrivivax sp. A210]CAD5371920.1 conserved exported hypothetical protein [Rubrivivax sp. A210]